MLDSYLDTHIHALSVGAKANHLSYQGLLGNIVYMDYLVTLNRASRDFFAMLKDLREPFKPLSYGHHLPSDVV